MDLIPNIPDDISRDCLTRVGYDSHNTLRAVCRSWKVLLNSPCFYQDRKLFERAEQRISMIRFVDEYRVTVYNPQPEGCGRWERLPRIPTSLGYGLTINPYSFCVKQKLIVLASSNHHTARRTITVFIYDFISRAWRRGADMHDFLCDFACSASPEGDLIYVVGGHRRPFRTEIRGLHTAAVYIVDENRWEGLPPMNKSMVGCKGGFIDGIFYAFDEYGSSAQVFYPNSRTWKSLENIGIGTWLTGQTITPAFGRLFSFAWKEVMEYNCTQNAWEPLAYLPKGGLAVSWSTVWRDQIFLGGINFTGREVLYMFQPPTQVEGTGMYSAPVWVLVQKPPGFQGIVTSAATLNI